MGASSEYVFKTNIGLIYYMHMFMKRNTFFSNLTKLLFQNDVLLFYVKLSFQLNNIHHILIYKQEFKFSYELFLYQYEEQNKVLMNC